MTTTRHPVAGPVADRFCEEDDCGTRLSRYNDGRYCSLHSPMVVPRTRGRKPSAA